MGLGTRLCQAATFFFIVATMPSPSCTKPLKQPPVYDGPKDAVLYNQAIITEQSAPYTIDEARYLPKCILYMGDFVKQLGMLFTERCGYFEY